MSTPSLAVYSAIQGRQPERHAPSSLLLIMFLLMAIGLLMMTSASVEIANGQYGDPFFFLKRQVFFTVLSGVIVVLSLNVPVRVWYGLSGPLMLVSFVLLGMVLVPGIGKVVNGSARWIDLGFYNLQPSEMAKLFFVVYLAAYLERRHSDVVETWGGFLKPMLILIAAIVLLHFEPDHGAMVIMIGTCFSMIFLAGAKLHRFLLVLACCLSGVVVLAIMKPYVLVDANGRVRLIDFGLARIVGATDGGGLHVEKAQVPTEHVLHLGGVARLAELFGQQCRKAGALRFALQRAQGHEVILSVEREPAAVDLAVQVNRHVGNAAHGAIEAHRARASTSQGDAAGDPEIAIEPGGPQHAAVHLHAHLPETRRGDVRRRLHAQVGGVGVGADHHETRLARRALPSNEGDHGAPGANHEMPRSGLDLPSLALVELAEAARREAPGHLRDGVVGRRRGVDERDEISGSVEGGRAGHGDDYTPRGPCSPPTYDSKASTRTIGFVWRKCSARRACRGSARIRVGREKNRRPSPTPRHRSPDAAGVAAWWP